MQISKNVVNESKTNRQVLMGTWVIVCIQKASHHFLQTFVHYACLRLRSTISHFIQNNRLYFVCNGWSAQALTALATLPNSVAWQNSQQLHEPASSAARFLCWIARIRQDISAVSFCSCKLIWPNDECALLPCFNVQHDISAVVNCCVVALSLFSSNIPTWSADSAQWHAK